MDLTVLGVFVVAALVVAAAPGPTVLQIFSHSMNPDPLRPASLIAGSIFANTVMVLVTVLGVSALIVASQSAFNLLRWFGSAYLLYLGVCYWRMRTESLGVPRRFIAKPYSRLFLQGALTSITNPKGLVFYVAFLPQFVSPEVGAHMQLALLGAIYIGLCLVVETGYALAGRVFSGLFMTAGMVRLKNRIVGTVLFGAGLSLLRYERA